MKQANICRIKSNQATNNQPTSQPASQSTNKSTNQRTNERTNQSTINQITSLEESFELTQTRQVKTSIPSQVSCMDINPLNPELNPICYLLALLGAQHFLHVSRIRVKLLTFRRLMSYIYIYIYIYIYGAPILDVSRSHTTTQHSR